MSRSIASLLPLIILAGTMPLLMIILCFVRSHALTFYVTLLAVAASLAALATVSPLGGRKIGILFIFDSLTLFYGALMLAAGLAIVASEPRILMRRPGDPEEYYILLLGAMLGALIVIASRHFASLFLGFSPEHLSLSLDRLPSQRASSRRGGHEVSDPFRCLLSLSPFRHGPCLRRDGTMDFSLIGQKLMGLAIGAPMALAGMVFLIVGVGFKIGLVPFHMWTPDVYEGSPAPIAAFIATISKGSMIGLLLRYFSGVSLADHPRLFLIFAIMAIASMFAGNLLALFQNNIKRLLAYSSIAHFGYLLVAILSAGSLKVAATTYYLVAYLATTLGAFGVVTLLSGKERDADGIDAYEGLGRRSPWLGGMLAFMLLSLAGMPLTAGFIGKFYVVTAGIGSSLWILVVILIVNSAIGLFYYLRVTAAVYRTPSGEASQCPTCGMTARLVVIVLSALVVWWGIYPAHLAGLIETMRMGQ